MHQFLQELMQRSGVNTQDPPNREQWKGFLEKIDETLAAKDSALSLSEPSCGSFSREQKEFPELSREGFLYWVAALAKMIPDLIFYLDEEGRCLDIISHGREEMLYLPSEEIVGHTIEEIFPPYYASKFMKVTREAIETNQLTVLIYDITGSAGKRFYEARMMPTNIRENGKRTAIAIVRDITAERKSIEYLKVIKKIFEDATEGILIVSVEEQYLEINDAFCRMLGISREELPGVKLNDYAEFFDNETMNRISDTVEKKDFFNGEVQIHKRDGSALLAWLTIDTIFNEAGERIYRVAMLTDISELEKSRKELEFTATHDVLTKLPNRTMLFEQLEKALSRSRTWKKRGALFFIDLDNFKVINDTAGHSAGDQVLQECARRIRHILNDDDIFGRLGGDEFLLIIENIENADMPMRIAQKIIKELHRPFQVENEIFELGASIGIALFPDDSGDKGELVRLADIAMYRAKKRGKGRFMFYSLAIDRDVKRHSRLEQVMNNALILGNFYLHYQPQLDLVTEKVTGFEALLRIDESKRGFLSPAEFIHVAEGSDLIVKIGRWVFDEVCRQLLAWEEKGIDPPLITINLSPRQFVEKRFVVEIGEKISRYGISPSLIEFEITETALMHSKKRGYQVIEALQKIGFGLSIDDFGTGYSSLVNLKHFTVDKLKIDRSFVRDMFVNESDQAIIRASIALARALGIRSIAEGVETAEQLERLKEMGCDEIQGYYFSPPVSPKEVIRFLR